MMQHNPRTHCTWSCLKSIEDMTLWQAKFLVLFLLWLTNPCGNTSNSESTYGHNLPHYTPSLQKFVDLPAFGSRYLGFVCCLSNRNCILTCGPSKKKGDSSSTFSLARRSRMESILWTLDNCICRGWHFRSVDVFLAENSSPKHIKKNSWVLSVGFLFWNGWVP